MPKRAPPTAKQAEVLDLMLDHLREHQRYPTIVELRQILGINITAVTDRLEGLIRKGWLARADGKARAYSIPGLIIGAHLPDKDWDRLPVTDSTAA